MLIGILLLCLAQRDLLFDGSLVLGLFPARAEVRPCAADRGKRALGKIRQRFRGKSDDCARRLQSGSRHALRDAGHAADRLRRRGGHIARLDRLPARAVRKDAGQQRRGFLRRLKAAVDQHQLCHEVQYHAVLKEHQPRPRNDRQIDEQQTHGDHRAEHAERLDEKRDHPLSGLAAAVKRLRGDHRRRDQIQEQHIEDARDTVENDDHQVKDQRDARNIDDDVVRGRDADIKILVDLVEIVNTLFPCVVGRAQRIVKRGLCVVHWIFRRVHGAHQEHEPIQRHQRLRRSDPCIFAKGLEGGVFPDDVHGPRQRARDALIGLVELEIVTQVGGVCHVLQDILPCVDRLSVLIGSCVVIAEHALLLQIIEVLPDLIEAGIDVVSAVVGRVERVVADGVQHTPHRCVLLIRIDDRFRQILVFRVVEQIIDLLHQDVGRVEDDRHDRAHAENQDNAPQQSCHHLSPGLLYFPAAVKQLAHGGKNGEAETQGDADQRHTPVNVADRVVPEKDVDEVIRLSVIGNLDDAGKHLKHLIQHPDDPAQAVFDVVQQAIDRRVQNRLQAGGDRIAGKLRDRIPHVAESRHLLPPALHPTFNFFLL